MEEKDMLDTVETVERPRTVPALIASTGGPVAIIPRDIDQVWRIATLVHKSGMAPKDFATAEKISVAIMHGAELGLSPLMSLHRIAVINGRPSIWGEAVPGLALATGLVEDWSERLDGTGDNMVASCTVKRKGVRSPMIKTFSVADARRANLWGKAGPWTQYPQRMLQMRARVAFRDLFADALGGLYIAEEVIGIEEPKDITPPRPAVEPPPPGGQANLPPLVPPKPVPEAAQAEIHGEVLPPKPKNGNGKGKKPLPPMAAEASKAAVVTNAPEIKHHQPLPEQKSLLSVEEGQKETDRLLDQLDFVETQTSLAAWASANVATKNRLPPEMKAKVETAFNLKQATIQKQGA